MRVAVVRPRGWLMVRERDPWGIADVPVWPFAVTNGGYAYEFIAKTLLEAGHRVTLVAAKVSAPRDYEIARYTDAPGDHEVAVVLQAPWLNMFTTKEEDVRECVGAFRWFSTGCPVVYDSDDPSYDLTLPDRAGFEAMLGFPTKVDMARGILETIDRIPRPITELVKTPHVARWNQLIEEWGRASQERKAAGWAPRWWNASAVVVGARPSAMRTRGGPRAVYVGNNRSHRGKRLTAIAGGLEIDVYGNWKEERAAEVFGPRATVRGKIAIGALAEAFDCAAASIVSVDTHVMGMDWFAPRLWEAPYRGCPVIVDRATFGDRVLDGFEPYVTTSPRQTAELVAKFRDPDARARAAAEQRDALHAYPWQEHRIKTELLRAVEGKTT